VSPSSLARGASATVTLNGSGFQKNVKVELSGTGVTVSKVTWVSPSTVTMTINATTKATTGTRSLIVTNPDLGTVSGAFTIT
jgi:hypothetical protein